MNRRGFFGALFALSASLWLVKGGGAWKLYGKSLETDIFRRLSRLKLKYAYEGPKHLAPSNEPPRIAGGRLIAREWSIKWQGEFRKDGKLVAAPGCVGIELIHHYDMLA